jgi:hypothetical protein
MTTLADRIGQAIAHGELCRARTLGSTVSFAHRGAAPVTLRAELSRHLPALGLRREGHQETEERTLIARVATGQEGFAFPTGGVEPVTPGDTIVHRGRTYYVRAPIRTEAYGHVYVLRCVERRRLASGVP